MVASGIRLGTPAVTSRGMGTAEMAIIAALIDETLAGADDSELFARIRGRVLDLCQAFPLYAQTAAV